MVEKVSELKPPQGISRLLFRAPIWLYKNNLGWLLGKRFLMITHVGRKSGIPRQVVLEIVKYKPSSETYYVAAAWGEHSDWVKNIRVNPQIQVQVSNQRRETIAETLTPEQAEEVILDYSERHPSAMMSLARMMGYKLDGSEQDFRDFGRQLLMFALKPLGKGNHS